MPDSLSDKLEAARLLIYNSKDPNVFPLLEAIGIDTPYLDQGEALYVEAIQFVEDQRKEYQEQNLAFDTFYVEKDAVETNYEKTRKLVKVLARNDINLLNRLGLSKAKVKSIEPWIDQAIDFYNKLMNETDFLVVIERFKITVDRLNQEKNAFLNLKSLRNNAIAEKGQAQEATRVRNGKLEELEDYIRELKPIAEMALESSPQLLEKLGILVRS